MTRHLILQRIVFPLVLLLVAVKFTTAAPVAKFYTIDRVEIEAAIQPDGSLLIQEDRTYTFRGNFSWADYALPLQKLGTVTDFELSEADSIYRLQPGKQPGTYQLSRDNKKFYVKWFYRASNETRTFRLKYRVQDAVTVYNDVAEFYYKFVGEQSPKKIDSVDVMLLLPQSADTGKVRAWAHGPLHGQLRFEDGKIHLRVAPLPRRSYWEVRVIFPPEWVPAASVHRDSTARALIMAQEGQWVEKSNAQRQAIRQRRQFIQKYRRTMIQISLLFAGIGLVLFMYLYQHYGKAHIVPFRGNITSEIPPEVSPAVASYVYYAGQLGAGAMVATLLDLARRGFLQIQETKQQKRSLFGTSHKSVYTLKLNADQLQKQGGDLQPHEQDLIELIFHNLAAGKDEIQLDQIKKSRRFVIKWFKNWKQIIVQSWGERSIYDKDSIKATAVFIAFSALLEGIGVFLLIKFGNVGVIALVAGIVLFVLSPLLIRYTREIKILRTRLIALRKYLLKYHFMRESGDFQSRIENYLVYAVALGIGSKVIKKMIAAIPEWESSAHFAWYTGAMTHGSPTGFATAIASMVSTTSATMGSAAGVGGGASAGGGAGAGGAAGGAG